ncbi:DUF2202 domain-containing protein [Dysgonomonas sp. 511]|uniref:DUF2202 domain-containing protein n=1 Tax=Dysgonomonas sp. 511 TaxID=2302930 RepID=UPI0013D345BE|nr:DUF2202 domain-containing protein [Dysgonomonas sp. 511]NDV80147.1 DUF2202 domain-containing protein [Dysgonomonas sp. 511]
MNTNNKLFAFLFMVFSFMLFSCSSENDFDDNTGTGNSEPVSLLKVTDEGISSFIVDNICPVLDATSPLTADEIEFLYVLREDEKMSRDLNFAFSSLYPTAVQFSRIGTAEATHITTIERLLDYYEIEYPALSPDGVFADEYRQSRYNELLAMGNTMENAYTATARLEEENIVAYNNVLENISNPNIKIIVSNLLKSSTNHFKAVVRQITLLGSNYTPSILDGTTYQEIISSNPGQGNKYQQKGKQGQNTNSGKRGQQKGNKGSVNSSGVCTGCTNGTSPGSNSNKGQTGKGYRGGK